VHLSGAGGLVGSLTLAPRGVPWAARAEPNDADMQSRICRRPSPYAFESVLRGAILRPPRAITRQKNTASRESTYPVKKRFNASGDAMSACAPESQRLWREVCSDIEAEFASLDIAIVGDGGIKDRDGFQAAIDVICKTYRDKRTTSFARDKLSPGMQHLLSFEKAITLSAQLSMPSALLWGGTLAVFQVRFDDLQASGLTWLQRLTDRFMFPGRLSIRDAHDHHPRRIQLFLHCAAEV